MSKTSSRLPGFAGIRPPKPTRRDEHVAQRIAERLIREIDPDLSDGDAEGCYWTSAELSDRIWELKQALIEGSDPQQLTRWCAENFTPSDWHWEGIADSCAYYAPQITREEVNAAVAHWRERYEV